MIEFIIKRASDDLSHGIFRDKKYAFEHYKDLCESYPKEKFKIIKKQVIEEVIAESEDHRQSRFRFIS